MDYLNGTHIAKWQWDLMHDPGVVVRVFEKDADAMRINYGKPITIKWNTVNPPRLLENKKELKYVAESGYEEPGKERTSFFLLEDKATIVARYQDPAHIAEQIFKYEIQFNIDGEKKWYDLNIHERTDDCLSCELTSTILNIYKSLSILVAQMLLIEDAYILITGDDFESIEASRVAAGSWIVVGVFGGKILKFVGYVGKELYIGSKFVINNSSKLYKLVKEVKTIKAVELSADEAVEVIAKSGNAIGSVDDALRVLNDVKNGKAIIADFAENSEMLLKLANDNSLVKAWQLVSSYSKLRKSETILNAAKTLLNNSNLSQSKLTDALLEKLIHGNRGYTAVELEQLLIGYDELITSGTKFEDIGKLIADLDKGNNFAVGARWVQKYIVTNANEFKGVTLQFEEVLKVGENVRRVDVTVKKIGDAKKIFYEFKSVKGVPPQHFAEQFIKDLSLADDLDQIKWIFDGKKVTSLDKAKFLDELRKTGISKDVIVKWTDSNDIEGFFKLIDKNFNNIFIIK
jgi:hypothetical protein